MIYRLFFVFKVYFSLHFVDFLKKISKMTILPKSNDSVIVDALPYIDQGYDDAARIAVPSLEIILWNLNFFFYCFWVLYSWFFRS